MRDVLAKMRFELARRHVREATGRGAMLGVVSGYLAAAAIWLAVVYLMPNLGATVENRILFGAPLIILGICGQLLLRIVAPDAASMRKYWPLMLVMFLVAAAEVFVNDFAYARLVPRLAPRLGLNGTQPMFAYPGAMVPLLVAMLYGGPAAMVIGLVTGVAMAMRGDFNLAVFLVSLCATCVIALLAPRASRRSQISGIVIRAGLMQFLVIAIVLYRRADLSAQAKLVSAAFFYCSLAASALACSLAALPLAEKVTRRLASSSISHFADLEHPLLRRLCLEAPGTYHHSMMVGDLAQAAAEAIGANGILARAGAYYHDIGKLSHPPYYMENQTGSVNPHDDLPPNISRIILVNHVKEGLALARLEKIPDALCRFIATHHGTSIARWFLVKEQERLASRGAANERSDRPEDFFRYPGPLPVTKEETIVSLADSVEAASRAMPFFDKSKIEGMVRSIIADRWADGQLSDSVLSEAELAAVRASFCETLIHLLHGRLPYPSPK